MVRQRLKDSGVGQEKLRKREIFSTRQSIGSKDAELIARKLNQHVAR
jgi:hypothetical protein